MSRVLVIGSGVAGAAAALAARTAGAQVTVVSQGPGATAFVGGTVWPTARALEGPLSDLFVPVPKGATFANVIGDRLTGTHALPAQARGALEAGQAAIVVGVRHAPQLLDAEWVAERLRAGSAAAPPVAARAEEVVLSLSGDEVRRSDFAWATALEDASELARLAEGLRRVPGEGLLLLPPLVGLGLDRLASLTGRPLGELAATTPSVPGLRLTRLLEARLSRAGCRRMRGEVRRLAPGRATLSSGETVEFTSAVLCTGRFLGGGHRLAEGFVEGVLELPLVSPEGFAVAADADVSALVGPALATPGLAFAQGLAVDARARVLAGDGRALPWLFAAGSLLSGPDEGIGQALATGVAAGQAAAREQEPVARSAVG